MKIIRRIIESVHREIGPKKWWDRKTAWLGRNAAKCGKVPDWLEGKFFVRFGPNMENRVILVAEDNQDDVLLVRRAFRHAKLQAELHFVSDGGQAMAYLKGRGEYSDRAKFPFPAFLVLDIKMPRMNGLEVLKAIREDPDLTRLTVIIFTSSAHERDICQASDLHANCYLVKPSDGEALMKVCKIFEEFWLKSHRRGPCAEEIG